MPNAVIQDCSRDLLGRLLEDYDLSFGLFLVKSWVACVSKTVSSTFNGCFLPHMPTCLMLNRLTAARLHTEVKKIQIECWYPLSHDRFVLLDAARQRLF